MNTNVAHWTKKHGVKVLSLMAASAITAALLSACSAAADNETPSGAPTGHRQTLATANADKNAGSIAGAAGAANTNPTGAANDAATVNGAALAAAPAPVESVSPAVEGLERGHTRTLVGWSDKGLVVTYAGWFCDPTMDLSEGRVDNKTANVMVTGNSDGNGVGCDKPTAISSTFTDVPRTAHVLKLDPGHGKQLETVKFESGDMVKSESIATEETARGINVKHAATH